MEGWRESKDEDSHSGNKGPSLQGGRPEYGKHMWDPHASRRRGSFLAIPVLGRFESSGALVTPEKEGAVAIATRSTPRK